MKYQYLFQPIKIGNMTVPNRIVHVPTDISTADSDGAVNDRLIAHHEEIAKGGTGLIIVGASTPDRNTGSPSVTSVSVDADYFIPGLRRLAYAMQRHGSKCAVQIQHPGRQASYPRTGQISCSDMITNTPCSSGHEVVYAEGNAHGKIAREMSVEEVYDMIDKFSEAAWRVQQAGFDSVELHGAHGYLISQFMSPYTNKRNDRFGGSFQNRMRFILGIIESIRMKCGSDFPIMVRFSGEEWIPGGRLIDESVEIAKVLEKAGVAALDISAGIFEAAGPTCDPAYYNEGWNTYSADIIKQAVSIPVITSHSLRNPEYCEKIIAEGKTDMIGLSRQLLADPYWPDKAKSGNEKDIRRCISCLVGCWKESVMIKREMICAVNPAIGDTRFIQLRPSRRSMKVAVVGGGVAGMEAAMIATMRGNKVTIFEKENELGGILRACCMVPAKFRMKWYLDWLREQLVKLNVEVKLNSDASKENLKDYDVVLCGTGAKTVVPEIPGAHKCVNFEDVMVCTKKNCTYWPKEGKKAPVRTGQKVLIWGNHYAASDTAELMAQRGREVIIVTEDDEFCPNIEPVHKEVMLMRFAGGNGQALEGNPIKIPVVIKTGTTVAEVKDGEVTLINNKFEKETLAVDTVILAKTEPDDELYTSLKDAGLKVANIGDSRLVRNIRGAMIDGAEAGLIIDDDVFMNANGILSSGLPTEVRLQLGQQ